MIKPSLFLLIVALSCTSLVGSSRDTCSCLTYVPDGASEALKVKYELKESKAVFAGTVLNITERKSGPFEGYLQVTLKVKQSWKRAKAITVSVITSPPSKVVASSYVANCGYPFQVGESYLVYVESMSRFGQMSTGSCSRTRKLVDATEDLRILGKGRQTSSKHS
jgi:hypothetical protein